MSCSIKNTGKRIDHWEIICQFNICCERKILSCHTSVIFIQKINCIKQILFTSNTEWICFCTASFQCQCSWFLQFRASIGTHRPTTLKIPSDCCVGFFFCQIICYFACSLCNLIFCTACRYDSITVEKNLLICQIIFRLDIIFRIIQAINTAYISRRNIRRKCKTSTACHISFDCQCIRITTDHGCRNCSICSCSCIGNLCICITLLHQSIRTSSISCNTTHHCSISCISSA